MSIFTTPVFYYGYTVTVNDIYINFDEGIGELTALVSAGDYSFTDLGAAIATALNTIGGQVYAVVANRADRTFTISASSPFDLLFSSGSNSGLSVASVIGFTATDKTGSSSYTSDTPAGSEFVPQFPLQDFVSFDDYQEFSQASVNESASGRVEVFSIGTRRFMEFNLGPVTDNAVRGLFTSDNGAVAKLRDFMQFLIRKADVEFMPDTTDRNTFRTIILETTPTSSTGTGYKLRELYGRGLVGFFETGKLKFRERT